MNPAGRRRGPSWMRSRGAAAHGGARWAVCPGCLPGMYVQDVCPDLCPGSMSSSRAGHLWWVRDRPHRSALYPGAPHGAHSSACGVQLIDLLCRCGEDAMIRGRCRVVAPRGVRRAENLSSHNRRSHQKYTRSRTSKWSKRNTVWTLLRATNGCGCGGYTRSLTLTPHADMKS